MNRSTQFIDENQSSQRQERKNPNLYSIVDIQNQSEIIVQDLNQQNVVPQNEDKKKVDSKEIEPDQNQQNNQIKIKSETKKLYKVQEIDLTYQQEQQKPKNKNQPKQVLQKTQKKTSKYQDQQSTDKKKKFQIQPEVVSYKQPQLQEPISNSQTKQRNNSPLLIQQKKTVQSLFSMNKVQYSNYIKAVFIQQEILDPIQKQNLLDYKQEKHLQFLFLITVRIRNYLLTSFKYFQQKQKTNKDFILKDVLETISAYIQKSQIKFQIYNERLDRIRQKLSNKISRILHLQKSVKSKQKFLDGYQNLDYTILEQVQFTHSNYIEIVLNSPEIKSEYFKNYRFKKILRGFRKICFIDPDSCANELELKNKINDIIIDQ